MDHKESGAFPLGCSICRTEKFEKMKKLGIKQVNTSADNMPKSFFSKRERHQYGDADDREDKNKLIVRPDVEIELPEFIAKADEVLEREIQAKIEAEERRIAAEKAAEEERIRQLNKMPVNVLNPRMIAKRQRQQKRKELKRQQEQEQMVEDDNLPAWFVNPLGEPDEREQELLLEAEHQA